MAARAKASKTEDGPLDVLVAGAGYVGLATAVSLKQARPSLSVAIVDAFESGAVRPTMTVLGEHAYVADPLHGEIVEVHVEDLEVERRLPVSITPGGVAGLAIPDAVGH